jgi:mRNA-degrading endonuclease RelE of RelBE toxin-antitoxin system
MTYEVIFSDESKLDIKETRDYYAAISSNLLLKFDTEFIETIELIKLNPKYFQKRYRTIKIIFTKKFPFGIHYLVEKDTIYVQRFLHQKRIYK